MFVDGNFYPVNGVPSSALGTGVADPPYVLADEARLLGSLLVKPSLWPVAERLERLDFSGPHGRIYEAIGACIDGSLEVTIVNVLNALHDSGRLAEVGGSHIITELYGSVGSLTESQVVELVGRVQRASAAREAITQMHKALAQLHHTPQHVGEHVGQLRHSLELLTLGGKSDFDGEGVATILEPQPEQPYIIPSLSVGPGFPTMFAGYSHSGKTMLLQDMLLDIAAGKSVFDTYRAKRSRCLHLNYDQSAVNTRRRYAKLLASKRYGAEDILGQLELVNRPTLYLNDKKAKASLRKKLASFDVCLIDSFLAALPGVDENASHVRRYLDELAEISEATGCTILVIHHAGKSKGEEVEARQKPRGSSAIVDALDGLFNVDVVPDTKNQCTVKQAKNKNEGTRVEFGITIDTTPEHIRLVHMDMAQLAQSDGMFTIKREVLDRLATPFKGNVLALSKVMKKRADDVRAACSMLEAEGKIAISGRLEKASIERV